MTDKATNNQAIHHVVIVGGDTIGWTAAMGLARGLQGQRVNIILINEGDNQQCNLEPELIHTSNHVLDFHQSMGVNEPYLFAHGHGQYTCARQYQHWITEQADFFIGNDSFLSTFNGFGIHHLASLCQHKNVSDYSFAAQIAKQHKSIPPVNERPKQLGPFNTGMIINSQGYKGFIRGAALHLGVKVINSSIEVVALDNDTGFVKQLTLTNGQQLPVDLLIDNSGSHSKIMQASLAVDYKELRDDIPFNTLFSITLPSNTEKFINKHYTTITANKEGWLEHSILQGTSYYTQLCQNVGDEEHTLIDNFLTEIGADKSAGKQINKYPLRFGHSERFFHNNCIVIGHAAGYVGSPSISNLVLAQRAISRLLDLFPTKACFSSTAAEYNRLTNNDYGEANDMFMLYLYLAATNEPNSIPKWAKAKEELSANLQQKIALFEHTGRYEDQLNAMINSPTWINLLNYCCRKTKCYDPLLAALDEQQMQLHLTQLKGDISTQVEKLPTIS